MFACGYQVAASVEVVLECGMDGKEALGRAGCSETLHFTFSSSDRNVRAVRLEFLILSLNHRQTHL